MSEEILITNVNENDTEFIREHFCRTFKWFNGYLLPEEFASTMHNIFEMNIRDDDVWVCSFPKAGTTWTQEMLWCIANDLNFSKAKLPLAERYIFIDVGFLIMPSKFTEHQSMQNKLKELVALTEWAKEQSGQRFFKTHLPYDLLPRKLRDGSTKAKIVYVARNPRDTCISSFHHRRMMGRFHGNLEHYCDVFIKGLVSYGPYWKHLVSYWSRQNDENLIFLKYENMKKDLPTVIKNVAEFLAHPVRDDDMGALCDHLSFDTMKNTIETWSQIVKNATNPHGNGSFFRVGNTDQWRKELPPETVERFEKWELENLAHLKRSTYSSL